MRVLEFSLQSEADTECLASALAGLNLTGSVWLSGDLGAGKTTLSRYWLQKMGHKGAVKSPTYTLVEPYVISGKPVYHADLYRLDDPEELDDIGFFDYFGSDSLVIIEWASRAATLLPEPNVIISLQVNDSIEADNQDSRLVTIQADEHVCATLLSHLNL